MLVSIHHPQLTTVKIVAEKVVSEGRVLFLFFYFGGKKRREKKKKKSNECEASHLHEYTSTIAWWHSVGERKFWLVVP